MLRKRQLTCCVLLAALGLTCGPGANGQMAGGDFEVRRSSVDNGGGISSGDGFALYSSIGQPDVGTANGGTFELVGGFWAPENSDLLFKDSYEG